MAAGLSIGALAERTGLAVSAIRYYEEQGLVHPWRNAGGQRRFHRADIRRLSFVMIAQQFGFTLPQIRAQLDQLPGGRTPSAADWAKISVTFRQPQNVFTCWEMEHKLSFCAGPDPNNGERWEPTTTTKCSTTAGL